MSKYKSDGRKPLKAQHEKFVRLCLAGESAAEAYVGAGYRPNLARAKRLKDNEKIKARLRYLRRERKKQQEVTEQIEAHRDRVEAIRDSDTVEPGSQPLDSEQRERFAQLCVSGRPAIHAYKEAGYAFNHANASRLRDHPQVRARIRWLKQQGATRAEVEAAYVIQALKDNYQRSIGELAVQTGVTKDDGTPIVDENGDVMLVPRYLVDLKAGNKALELLGKSIAMFTDVKAKVPFEDLSNDELTERVRRLLE